MQCPAPARRANRCCVCSFTRQFMLIAVRRRRHSAHHAAYQPGRHQAHLAAVYAWRQGTKDSDNAGWQTPLISVKLFILISLLPTGQPWFPMRWRRHRRRQTANNDKGVSSLTLGSESRYSGPSAFFKSNATITKRCRIHTLCRRKQDDGEAAQSIHRSQLYLLVRG